MTVRFHCKDCKNRTPGCHITCEIYKRDSAEWQKIKEKMNADREIDGYVRDAVNRSVTKSLKRHKKTVGYNWLGGKKK